jgi:DNA-binding IclR family transcriptional regulator
MAKTKKNYSAPALEKGLDIIELLSKSSLGFSQAEIAKELKRSVNEIYRMLNILVTRNYIELDLDSDRYKLTFKLITIIFTTSAYQKLNAKITSNDERSCSTL